MLVKIILILSVLFVGGFLLYSLVLAIAPAVVLPVVAPVAPGIITWLTAAGVSYTLGDIVNLLLGQKTATAHISDILGIDPADVGLRTAKAILGVLFLVLAAISITFAALAAEFLLWVVSPFFIHLSYTNPAYNPIIQEGLKITQSFVNIILVLVLIFIALTTILRLAGYETKKLLITFIFVALLVNFSPVLSGLIVDATNIVMRFFLGPDIMQQFTHLSESFVEIWDLFKKVITEMFGDRAKQTQALFNLLFVAIFGLLAGIAFLIFSLLFLIRYVAIWILVILSPLAFACFILPATKPLWTLWWNQFLQWSIIGITGGFFLYLAAVLINQIIHFVKAPQFAHIHGGTEQFFMYLVPIVFLYIGIVLTLSTSAWGAQSAISLAKKGGGWTMRTGWKGVRAGVRAIERRPAITKAEEKIAARLERVPLIGKRMAIGVYRHIHRKEEALKKGLEGVPLRLRAHRLGKSIGGMTQGLSPRQFRDISPGDINFEVFSAATMQQLEEVSQRGSVALKGAIRNNVRANSRHIVEEWKKLTKEGRQKEAIELIKKFKLVRTDPNYQV